MPNPGGFAMCGLVANDLPSKGLAEALMAEAYAEDGDLAIELRDRLVGNSSVFRRAGTRRDDHTVVTPQLDDAHLVVAKHSGLDPELAEVLDQVVGERIVVVDDGEPGGRSVHHRSSAISIALNIAPAFSSVSSNSRSGRESATTPAPACTYATPPATTMGRSAIAIS